MKARSTTGKKLNVKTEDVFLVKSVETFKVTRLNRLPNWRIKEQFTVNREMIEMFAFASLCQCLSLSMGEFSRRRHRLFVLFPC